MKSAIYNQIFNSIRFSQRMTRKIIQLKKNYKFVRTVSYFHSITKKLSRDEICVANFIPPANGASLGSYLVKNWLFCHLLGQKVGPLPRKKILGQQFLTKISLKKLVHSISPVLRSLRSNFVTDRQTDKFFDILVCVDFFFKLKGTLR